MNPIKNLLTLVIICYITGCCEQPGQSDEAEFSGLWRLHIMETKDTETGSWSEWRDGMQGYLLYDNQGNMALHLTVKGYEQTDFNFPNFTDTIPPEVLGHLTGSYVYFARYSVDEEKGFVKHSRISHSNPAEWNIEVTRRYMFRGDSLLLEPVEEQNSRLRLKWVRTGR